MRANPVSLGWVILDKRTLIVKGIYASREAATAVRLSVYRDHPAYVIRRAVVDL